MKKVKSATVDLNEQFLRAMESFEQNFKDLANDSKSVTAERQLNNLRAQTEAIINYGQLQISKASFRLNAIREVGTLEQVKALESGNDRK